MMTQRRSAARILTAAAACLLLGAILTSLVAWRCYIAHQERFAGWAMAFYSQSESDGVIQTTQGDFGTTIRTRLSGWLHAETWARVESTEVGLPLRAAALVVVSAAAKSDTHRTIVLWPGFAVDTALYGAAPFLAYLLIGPVRRSLRRRRGNCPACGYDLSGIAIGTCPECGKAAHT
jgi:hypothetical protein